MAAKQFNVNCRLLQISVHKECLLRTWFPKISKRAQNWFGFVEVFIFANNSFLRYIVNPSVETEFWMHVCTTLSIFQQQARNQMLQLLCNKRMSFISHIANLFLKK